MGFPCPDCCEEESSSLSSESSIAECELVCGEDRPDDFQVTFAGIIEDGCGDCDTWNDSFILSFDYETVDQHTCRWAWASGESPVCGMNNIDLAISYRPATEDWAALVRLGGPTVVVHYQRVFIERPDCKTWSSLDVPYSLTTWAACDPSASTCSLTAL